MNLFIIFPPAPSGASDPGPIYGDDLGTFVVIVIAVIVIALLAVSVSIRRDRPQGRSGSGDVLEQSSVTYAGESDGDTGGGSD